MKIIGHRGSAGLALENSLASLKAAEQAGVDAVEIDVRVTSDGQLVLCHDPTTQRVADQNLEIISSSLAQLQKVRLKNGEILPSLRDALQALPNTHFIIEGKANDWAEPLAQVIQQQKRRDISVITFNFEELKRFHKILPQVPTYALALFNPFGAISFAARAGFTGIDIYVLSLNPFTYRLARRRGLAIIVYNIDWSWMVAYCQRMYPQISLTTNFPNKMQRFRSPPRDQDT